MNEHEPSSRSLLQIFVRPKDGGLSFEVHSDFLGLHNAEMGTVPPGGDARAQAQEELGRRLDRLSELAEKGERGQESARQQLASIGTTLFRQLPKELRELLWEEQGRIVAVQILSDEPYIPWELVKLQGMGGEEGQFLCEAFQVTRWLRTARQDALELPLQRIAFVLPRGSGLPSTSGERADLLDLVGAERLATIAPTLPDVSAALAAGEYDGWHFAGHGLARSVDPNAAAFRLDEDEDESLTPESLSGAAGNFGRLRPLIFLNACTTGRGGYSLTGLGGWAQQSLAAGAGAFLGTLWPVRDQKARTFACTFYKRFLDGETIGEAVRLARLKVQEEFPGDPAWLAYTVYGHPQARVSAGADAPFLHRDTLLASKAIREKILPFDLLIRRKTEGFVGRQWLFDAIDRFVAGETRGYVQILGDPGIGKTSLIAEMVKRHRHPHHFNVRAEGIQKPDQFLPSLCAQLIALFRLGYSALPSDVAHDASFLVSLLEKAAAKLGPGRKLSVLVDALDESDPTAVTRGSNTLYLPKDLPDGVFFVVTSRRGGPSLSLARAAHKIDLQNEAGNNFKDVRLFAEAWLGREGIQAYLRHQDLEATAFVDEIVHLSEGNFMYLVHVLPEIEKGNYKDTKFTDLPAGLQDYYEDHWQRMRGLDRAAWEDYKVPVLVALTIAKEPLSIDLIAELSGVEKRAHVRAVLAEWAPFLHTIPEDGSPEIRWRLYHDSFHDFIAAKDQIQDELVDLTAAHRKAAAALWKALYPEGSGVPGRPLLP